VSMVDWNTGAPNARFRVLELLKNHFSPGLKLVQTQTGTPYVYGLGFIDRDGKHKLLLVNKRDRDIELTLPQPGNEVQFVDGTSKSDPPKKEPLNSNSYTLRGLAVAIVTLT
jgi:hypothetical protein